ncbi:MAG TPA: hypothetical protein VE568_00040 [Rubrobacter sp.]|nr:hypothetical protein [Rubrobacter sp.]
MENGGFNDSINPGVILGAMGPRYAHETAGFEAPVADTPWGGVL